MKLSGFDVLQDLRQSLSGIREQAAALRSESQSIDAAMRDLVSRRSDAFLQLARLYLPHLSRESIARTFDEARADLQQVIDRKDRTETALTGQLQRLRADFASANGQLRETTGRLDELVGRRESLQAELAARLKDHPEFQTLSRTALEREQELKKNESRAEEVERDARDKLPAYERSRLFQYLYDRKFGGADYAAGGTTRLLDRWVARLIGYETARRSYEFLTNTPPRMRDEVERRRADVDAILDQAEDFEQEAAETIGLTAILRQGQEVGTVRDRQVAQVNDLQQRVAAVEHQLTQLGSEQGQFYAEALQRFQSFLMKADMVRLERNARTTPDTVDDELVSRIRWLGEEIDRLAKNVPDLVTRTKELDARQEGLDFVVRRFQQSNFDSQRSYFRSTSEIERTLAQLETGAVTRDALWSTIRSHQAFEPTWVEQNAGSVVQHPLTGVLLHAMVEVAGAALQHAASSSRAHRSSSGHSSGFPSSSSPSSSSFGGGASDGGFTSGEGF